MLSAGSAVPHLEALKEKFLERKFPEVLLDKQFKKAISKQKRFLIFQGRKQKTKDNKIRLIFTHNSGNPPLHQWRRQAKQKLKTPKAKDIGSKLQIVKKQQKNLKMLVGGDIATEELKMVSSSNLVVTSATTAGSYHQ